MNVNELNEKYIAMLARYSSPKGDIVRAGKIKFIAKDDASRTLMVHAEPSLLPIAAPIVLLYAGGAEIGNYLIVSGKGCMTVMDAMAFEAGHTPFPTADQVGEIARQHGWEPKEEQAETIDLDAADFSDALMWLKEGKRVQRAGWNGTNQWVEMVKNSGLVFRSEHDSTAFSVADGLVLKNAQGIVVQWVPSIGDLMAEDWQVVGKNVDEPSYRTVSSDGRETLNFVTNTLPHQRRVIEEYDQLYKRHQDLTKFFDTDLYRSLSVEERNRLKEQSLFMSEYQRVLLERIRAF
nr:DUF2829 domain-containing protein [Leclercia sp.]